MTAIMILMQIFVQLSTIRLMKHFSSSGSIANAKPTKREKVMICRILPSVSAFTGFAGTKPMIVSQKPGSAPALERSPTCTAAPLIAAMSMPLPGWKKTLNASPKITAIAVVAP